MTAIRHKCGFKFEKEATLYKTDGKCPKCSALIDRSYASV